jgi:ATP/maltotriose-dependent transcriptional regulator MalT
MLQAGDVGAAAANMSMIENAQDTSLKSIVQARLAFLSGNAGEAERLATRAWEEGTTGDRAAAAALIAQLKILQGANGEAAAWAAKAAASADPSPTVRSELRAMAATAACLDNRAVDGLRQLSDLPADPALVEHSRQSELTTRGVLRMIDDDWTAARDDLRAASMGDVGSRLTPRGLTALATLGNVEFRLGDWDESLAHAQQALSLVTDTGQVWLLALMHATIVLVLAGRGMFDAARRHVKLANRTAADVGDSASAMYAADSAVHLAACRGDAAAVLQEACPLAAEPSQSPRVLGVLAWRPTVAAALVAERRLDEAAEALDVLERDANHRGHRSTLAVISRVQGELAAARGDAATARSRFQAAVQAPAGVATALDQARAHASYGRFLRRHGERRAAADQLRAAHGSFVRLGAQAYLDRLQAELAACGLDASRAPRPERLSLTPQELAVARLVCRGMSNREVAAELVLSVKTISYHLGNVYGKLGVNSRTQLAAKLLSPEPRAN